VSGSKEGPSVPWAVGGQPAAPYEGSIPDDRIRAENAYAAPLPWPSFELTWGISRWMPTSTGWSILGFVVVFALVFLLETTARLESTSGGVELSLLGLALVPIVIAVAVVEILPRAHERASGRWTMRVSPESLSVEETGRGRPPAVSSIARAEAGQLAIEFTDANTRKALGNHLAVAMFGALGALVMRKVQSDRSTIQRASAFSVDGRPVVTLTPARSRLTSFGRTGRAVPIDVLVAWWPVNSRSQRALRDYENLGTGYWAPLSVYYRYTKFAPTTAAWSEPAPGPDDRRRR
jgi:hypothetical protein